MNPIENSAVAQLNVRTQPAMDRAVSLDDNRAALKILNGWKEIANYLGRGVRTVQRWEALGLPVRRPTAHLRSPVFATARELDAWLVCCGTVRRQPANGTLVSAAVPVTEVDQLRREVAELRRELAELRARVLPQPVRGTAAMD